MKNDSIAAVCIVRTAKVIHRKAHLSTASDPLEKQKLLIFAKKAPFLINKSPKKPFYPQSVDKCG